jgi:hypothetical protein
MPACKFSQRLHFGCAFCTPACLYGRTADRTKPPDPSDRGYCESHVHTGERHAWGCADALPCYFQLPAEFHCETNVGEWSLKLA